MSYGPPPPGGAPMYPPYSTGPVTHPRATTILVLGILGLVCCGPLGVAAWLMGNNAIREIDASGGTIGGRSTVQAGRVCGIIATALLVLGIVVFLLAAVFGHISFSTSRTS